MHTPDIYAIVYLCYDTTSRTPFQVTTSEKQLASALDQVDETAAQDDTIARTPPPKSNSISSSAPQTPVPGPAASVITSWSTITLLVYEF